jgi:hypothetical protein
MTNTPTTVQGAWGSLSLAAESKGKPGAMPVLLARGGGRTRHAWEGVTDDLANAGLRSLVVDMCGRGDSDLRVDYQRPAISGLLLATGLVIKCGRQISKAETIITNSDGKPLSGGRGAYI